MILDEEQKGKKLEQQITEKQSEDPITSGRTLISITAC
jgi:hypothetical protein